MGKSGKSMKPVKGGTPKGKFKAPKKKVTGGVKGLKDMNNKKDEGSAQRMVGFDLSPKSPNVAFVQSPEGC
jgi:hypothetical protein